jgi:hypothetical protein
MGLFDIPAPIFAWIDGQAAAILPSWLRLILWGMLAATGSMLLYRRLSPQERIRQGKQAVRLAQQRLNAFDGEFKAAWPLMRQLLRSALGQVARVGGPAIVASVPLLFLLSWMGTTYGYHYPENGEPVRVQAEPERFQGKWMPPSDLHAGNPNPRLVVSDERDHVVVDAAMEAPVPVIHKHRWWNVLIGNPVGYLPDEVPVEVVKASLPRQQHLGFGPGWVRGWEFVFFAALLVMSMSLKMVLRIV